MTFHGYHTHTARAVTCVFMEMHKNVLKLQGSPLCKQNPHAVLYEVLTRWEMKMNWEKTEVMKVGKERGQCCVEVGDRRLESVEAVQYLGVRISGDGRIEEEVRSRIGKAARIIGALNEPVWKRKN